MNWNHQLLWDKAKTYARRGHAEPRDSELFPLWCAFALEFLARASIARRSPALLADPQDHTNLLYALELRDASPKTVPPKSIPFKTVVSRCKELIPSFTDREADFCMAYSERRNDELHSGAAPFADYDTRTWLAHFYRTSDILCDDLGGSIEELLGAEDGKAARQMITVQREKIESSVKAAIRRMKDKFYRLSDVEQRERRDRANEKLKTRPPKEPARGLYKRVTCPGCSHECWLIATHVRSHEPRLVDGMLNFEVVGLPVILSCPSCDLELEGHEEVDVAGFGGQFSVVYEEHPFHYYNPQDDYGND